MLIIHSQHRISWPYYSPRGFKVSIRTIEALHRLEHATNLMEIRLFLRLCHIFPPFVPIFPRVAVSLNKRLRKGQSHTIEMISNRGTTALETLKAKLIKTPVLMLPRWEGNYTVYTDACDKQTGWPYHMSSQTELADPWGTDPVR